MIDVSVFVSSLGGGWFSRILDSIQGSRLRLFVSHALLEELKEVCSRPRLRKWFTRTEAEDLVAALSAFSSMIEPSISVEACRDPDDNYLLALAESAAADILVTRDEDLLALRQWGKTQIIPPARFMKILAEIGHLGEMDQ